MGTVNTLKRSFLLGYGGSAGHSAWRGTKNNIGPVILAIIAVIVAVAPIYFTYKLGKSLLERPDNPSEKLGRIVWFTAGSIFSTMYFGWAIFFLTMIASGFVSPSKIPGYSLVPASASVAMVANAEASLVRSIGIVQSVVDFFSEKKTERVRPPANSKSDQDVLDAGNLAVRLYAVVFGLGLFVGNQQRREVANLDAIVSHNAAFFDQHGLDLSDDGILSDAEGNTYRMENRSSERLELLALHRRNMRGYIDMDGGGKMLRWSGLVRRGAG